MSSAGVLKAYEHRVLQLLTGLGLELLCLFEGLNTTMNTTTKLLILCQSEPWNSASCRNPMSVDAIIGRGVFGRCKASHAHQPPIMGEHFALVFVWLQGCVVFEGCFLRFQGRLRNYCAYVLQNMRTYSLKPLFVYHDCFTSFTETPTLLFLPQVPQAACLPMRMLPF